MPLRVYILPIFSGSKTLESIKTPTTFAILFAPSAKPPRAVVRTIPARTAISCHKIWTLLWWRIFLTQIYNSTAIAPEITGQRIHDAQIFAKVSVSVGLWLYTFQPIIPPTIACEIETLMPDFSIIKTASAEDSDTVNAAGSVLTSPSAFRVSAVFCPLTTAPKTKKIQAITAAVVKRSILVPTAVPKIFDASLAPKDHPRKSPLDRKNRYSNIA